MTETQRTGYASPAGGPVDERRLRLAAPAVATVRRETSGASRAPVVLALKTQAAALASAVVARQRLLARLAEVRTARVTLLQSPAGYGRTTLMLQWLQALRADSITAWLTLATNEREPAVFVRYLIAALEAGGFDVGPELSQGCSVQGDELAEEIIIRLVNRLAGEQTAIFLFLDDAHHLTGSPSAACLRALIESAPASLHIVLASRQRLDLQLARLRTADRLLELGVLDLRLTLDELTEYLTHTGWSGLDPTTLQTIEQRTEGWIAGVKLVELAHRRERYSGGGLETFSGEQRHIAEFFEQEVWSHQPPEVQQFLLKTSVLDWLCAPLCDALVGQKNSGQMLKRCEDLGLFVTPLDESGSSYRYHPLFMEFLRHKLREQAPDEADELLCRVCGWLQGEIPSLVRIAAQVPRGGQAQQARAMLAVAWPLALAWQFDRVEDLLLAARYRLRDLNRTEGTCAAELRELEIHLEHVSVVLNFCRDDVRGLDVRVLELLRRCESATDGLVKGSQYAMLIATRREQFKLDDIDRNEAQCRMLVGQGVAPHAMITLNAIVGTALYMAGRTEAALKCLRAGLEQSIEGPHHGIVMDQMTALPLADIHYERNEVPQAAELIDKYLPLGAEFGFADQVISGWLTYARILRRKGDLSGALRALDELTSIGVRAGFERVRLLAGAERIKYLEGSGQSAAAADVGRELALPQTAAALRPADRTTSLDEARALAWVRLAESQGRVDDARQVAERWRSFFSTARTVRCLVRWEVLLAHLNVLAGDVRAARRILHDAITSAAPGRFIRTFVEEGPAIGALVLEQPRVAGRALTFRERFEAEISAAFEAETGAAKAAAQPLAEVMLDFSGSLTARERELLALVGGRLTNREIGDRLGMSEASVKWSLQLIFDKIGVRKRSEAAERARRFGLIT